MNAASFLSGILTMGYAVVSLFFLRFWYETHDRLFAWFAAGFAILCIQRALLGVIEPAELLYTLRLVAFVLIGWAVVDKNRGR